MRQPDRGMEWDLLDSRAALEGALTAEAPRALGRVIVYHLDLAGEDLCGLHLRNVRFQNCVLRGTSLAGGRFENVIFSGCDAEGAILTGVHAEALQLGPWTRFHHSDWRGAVLRGVVHDVAWGLASIQAEGALLDGAPLTAARLEALAQDESERVAPAPRVRPSAAPAAGAPPLAEPGV